MLTCAPCFCSEVDQSATNLQGLSYRCNLTPGLVAFSLHNPRPQSPPMQSLCHSLGLFAFLQVPSVHLNQNIMLGGILIQTQPSAYSLVKLKPPMPLCDMLAAALHLIEPLAVQTSICGLASERYLSETLSGDQCQKPRQSIQALSGRPSALSQFMLTLSTPCSLHREHRVSPAAKTVSAVRWKWLARPCVTAAWKRTTGAGRDSPGLLLLIAGSANTLKNVVYAGSIVRRGSDLAAHLLNHQLF